LNNNLTCRLDCEKLHMGTYDQETGECIRFEALRRVCILVDIDNEDKSIQFEGGCYDTSAKSEEQKGRGEITDYDTMVLNSNITYPINTYPDGVIIEVRSKYDPYTVFAEVHYNIGRDLEIIKILS
jgi:hypothetical protein